MYQPELKVDNKPLRSLPHFLYTIKVGSLLMIGKEARTTFFGTDMAMMKRALAFQKEHGLPWLNTEKVSLIISLQKHDL